MAWSDESGRGESDVGALIRRGSLEQAEGNLEEAESLFREALRVIEQASADAGANDDELPLVLRELSRLYIQRAEFKRAEAPLVRLLAITEAHGEDRPEVATVLASLAAVRHALGDYSSAEQLYRQALNTRERTLAPNHITTAATMESLAETCAARGRFAEAVSLCNRALASRETTLGADDASLHVARARIADLQLEAAEERRVSTPVRAMPAQASSPLVAEPLSERRPSAGESPLPSVLIPWGDELSAVREEIESAAPVAFGGSATWRDRSSMFVAVAAGIVVVAALGFRQLGNKPDPVGFVEAEPLNPAAHAPPQPVAAAASATLPSPATSDSIADASTRDVAASVSSPVVPRASLPPAVTPERPRPQAPSPSVPVVKPPQRASASDPAPLPVEKAPEPRGRTEPVNAPTSPTLIGAAPKPQYPEALREQQVEGDVVVQFVVDETGRADVSSMTIVRSPHALLTNAARAVLPQFRFEPARTAPPQSIPRPETVRYTFTFRAPRR